MTIVFVVTVAGDHLRDVIVADPCLVTVVDLVLLPGVTVVVIREDKK
jgi:hypothetical protein